MSTVKDRTSEVLNGDRVEQVDLSELLDVEALSKQLQRREELLTENAALFERAIQLSETPEGVLRCFRALSPQDQSAVLAQEDVAARCAVPLQAVLAAHDQALGLACGYLMEAGGLELETLREALGPYFREPVLSGDPAPGHPST